MDPCSGVCIEISPEQRRKSRSERLDDLWEAYGSSSCLPLAQPSLSLCKIRRSFETPEARNSFCLGAYRPEEDVLEIDATAAESPLATPTLLRQASSLKPSGICNLQRTDVPLYCSAPALDVTTQRRHSLSAKGADVAVEEHRMSVDLKNRRDSAPARLSVDQIWDAGVAPRPTFNPFNNVPNTEGFFG